MRGGGLPAQRIGRRRGLPPRRRRRDHAQGIQGRLRHLCGGWLDRARRRPRVRRPGLPYVLASVMGEMLSSAGLAFATYPGLTSGAYHAIEAHGTEAQKETYLPKLASGVWAGTMNLTEPQCGTDLGLIRNPRRAARRRQLPHHRHQDLHHRRRARSDREHRPPGAGADSRRARRDQGHQPVHRAQVRGGGERRARRAQRRQLRLGSSTRWASRPRPPA